MAVLYAILWVVLPNKEKKNLIVSLKKDNTKIDLKYVFLLKYVYMYTFIGWIEF